MRTRLRGPTVDYSKFIESKRFQNVETGFDADDDFLNDHLFDFQRVIVKWALKKGRAAIFADTGMGKSLMQLTWAWAVHQYTGNRVLIVAPLCVAQQTEKEAEKFGMRCRYVREFVGGGDTGIYVTNYDMLDKFQGWIEKGYFDGIVLDESSILKNESGRKRNQIIEMCSTVPYRLSCSATPSPNDHMELGSQAEFLGIMSSAEMLATFFIHDSGETSKWRLKGHGKVKFWEWLSTWAVCLRRPSDLEFDDKGYELPPLEMIERIVSTSKGMSGALIAKTLSERIEARRFTIAERVAECAKIVNQSTGPFLVWCNLNEEAAGLVAAIDGAIEVRGTDKPSDKERKLMDFTEGRARVLVTKPKIAGFGMNWQHCSQMAFVGLNDSFEQLYQSIRRCYRFGQQNSVKVFLISSDLEGETLANIKRKEAQHNEMSAQMVLQMRDFSRREVRSSINERVIYHAETDLHIPEWLH